MSISLGAIIKKLRIKKRFSQKELAEGICSEKQLSRIENNASEASTYIIYELSFRLGENLLEYLPYADLKEPFFWKEKIEELEQHYKQEKYPEMLEKSRILKKEKEVEAFVFLKKRVNWYFCIATSYCDSTMPFSAADFLQLIALTHPFEKIEDIWKTNLKPFEIRILNSAIFIYLKKGQYEIAEEWMRKTIDMFECCYFEIKDHTYISFFYNLSRLYFIKKQYEKALEIAERGIALSQRNNILSPLSELCSIKGRSLYCLGEKEEALLYLNAYLQLDEILYENSFHRNKEINKALRENYRIAPLRYLEDGE